MSKQKTVAAARQLSKHFKSHWELPMRLDKYLTLYHGFHKKKAVETIPIPKAIEIFDTRKNEVVSYYDTEFTSSTLQSLRKDSQTAERRSEGGTGHKALAGARRRVTFNTLIYPHERVIINTNTGVNCGKPLQKPVPLVYALYKPMHLRCDLREERNTDIAKWLALICSEQQQKSQRLLSESGGGMLLNNSVLSTEELRNSSAEFDDSANANDDAFDFDFDSDLNLTDQSSDSSQQKMKEESEKQREGSSRKRRKEAMREWRNTSDLPLRLSLIGRLDIDCSGLILATNDGMLQSLLSARQCQLSRIYRVNVARLHPATKFRRIQQLATTGRQLKKDIGHVTATRVVSRGRMDSFERDFEIPRYLRDLQRELDDGANDDNGGTPVSEDHMDAKSRMEKRIKLEEKKWTAYMNSASRMTQWDIEVSSGQHKVVKRMLKSMGFTVRQCERVGYGPLHVDESSLNEGFWAEDANTDICDTGRKQWGEHNLDLKRLKRNDFTRHWQLDANGKPKHSIHRLARENTYQLTAAETKLLWQQIGGMEAAIALKLQSLLDRALHVDDTHFWKWLNAEYKIKI